jgi:catechol 2,3-dioxygenase-like lactoylglutathione lyase family enzyme
MTQDRKIVFKFDEVVIDAKDARTLASFYEKLLGWERVVDEPYFVRLNNPDGGATLGFQSEETYVPPVWPDEAGKPAKMEHVDFQVSDLQAAVELAESLGAKKAEAQFIDGIVVMIDPSGHPFCLIP